MVPIILLTSCILLEIKYKFYDTKVYHSVGCTEPALKFWECISKSVGRVVGDRTK